MLVLELRRIEQFVGNNVTAAEDAYVHIAREVERFLWRYLRVLLPNEEDRSDAIQDVLERLLRNRTKIEARSLGAWWAYIATAGRWCVYSTTQKSVEFEYNQDVPIEDLAIIEIMADQSDYRPKLYRAADELWLGVEPNVDDFERKRRLLAAQFHYLHGRSWDDIAAIVGLRKPVSRDQFDAWLVNSAVLHELSYVSLYMNNDELAGTVLRPSEPLTRKEVDEWMRAAERASGSPPENWTWDEIRVVILRYRNGLPEAKIAQMTGIPIHRVHNTIEKSLERVPYPTAAKMLKSSFRIHRAPIDPLKSPGLWKRLAFQYFVSGELPQRQILDLMRPSAEVGGYSLTAGVLNVWLSGKRLFTQLEGYLENGGGIDGS